METEVTVKDSLGKDKIINSLKALEVKEGDQGNGSSNEETKNDSNTTIVKTPEQIEQEKVEAETKKREEAAAKAEADKKTAEATAANNGDQNDESQQDNTPTVLNVLTERFGNIDGINVEDPNSVEAVAAYLEKRIPTAEVEGVNKFFQAVPIMKSLYDHLQQGYTIESWKEQVKPSKYEGYKLNEEDEVGLISVIQEANKERGLSDARIKILIEAAKDTKTLKDEAKEDLKFLQEKEKEKKKAFLEKDAERVESEKREALKQLNEVKTLVTSGKVGIISIPEKHRQNFLSHLVDRGEDGSNPTGNEKFYDDLSIEESLMLDYVLYLHRNGELVNTFKIAANTGKLPSINRTGSKISNDGKGGGENGERGEISVSQFNDLVNKKFKKQ